MKNNWNKILNELSYRVSSGIPDLTNEQHLMKLWDILREHNWNIDARVELIKNLNEMSIVKNKKSGNIYPVKKFKPQTQTIVKKNATKDDIEKAKQGAGEDEFDTSDTSKEKETKSIRDIRIHKNKNPLDFENDSIEDIAKKTTTSEFKETNIKQAHESVKETRRKVFEEGLTGKGGGDTRLQEEMSNIAKDIGFENPQMSETEIQEALIKKIQDEYPDSDIAKNEKKIKKLSKVSTGGLQTAKSIMNSEGFEYKSEQPEGHPVSTTDGDVVRDALLTKYKEAKKSGDEKLIKHYEKELTYFQKKASDKSITGTEGDADTMVMYTDNDGNLRTTYVTNKQSESDMLSNANINTVTLATESAIQPGADVTAVTRIQQNAMEQGQGFNNRYVKNSQKVIEDNRQDLKDISDIIGKAGMASSGKSEFHSNKPSLTYLNDNLKNKDVLDELEKAGLDVKEVKNNPEKFASEIMQAGLDSHDSVESIGTGSQGVAYSTVKTTKVTRSIRKKVDAVMRDNPNMSVKEACDMVSKSKGTSGAGKDKPLYNGAFSGEDIEKLYNNEGLKKLEDEHIKRDRSMDKMYDDSIRQLRETDIQYYIDEEGMTEEEALEKSRTQAGPNEKSYTAGFLKRTKLYEYITGEVDGKVVSEMGTNAYSPKQVRQALSKAIGFDGDTENSKEFLDYVLNNVRADSESQTLTFIDKDNKEVTIGIDAHRLAGRNEKMAGQYGPDMVKALKEISKRDK